MLADGLVSLTECFLEHKERYSFVSGYLFTWLSLLSHGHVLLGRAARVLVRTLDEIFKLALVLRTNFRNVEAVFALGICADLTLKLVVLTSCFRPEEILECFKSVMPFFKRINIKAETDKRDNRI